jgi:two-component system, chemotaxis family, CheB/CheR fusion protein
MMEIDRTRPAIGQGAAEEWPIAKHLASFATDASPGDPLANVDRKALTDLDRLALNRVLSLIQARTGRDFSRYERANVLTLLFRRMQLQERRSIKDYLRVLRGDPGEVSALLSELSVAVTHFFRDPEVWKALERQVVDPLLDQSSPGRPLRAWVAGCSTGEEAYSLAIVLLERLSHRRQLTELVIHASDVDEAALAVARAGVYPSAISAHVSEERLSRFFQKEGAQYRVSEQLRQTVTFATHDLLRGPALSNLDLVSCRNLLGHLDPEAQELGSGVLKRACRPGGFLFLGLEEKVSQHHFEVVDNTHRIFRAMDLPVAAPAPPRGLEGVSTRELVSGSAASPSPRPPSPIPFATLHRELLEGLAPHSILVDQARHAVHLSETAGRYLRLRGGPLTNDVTELVRPELQLELRANLKRVFESGETILSPFVPVTFDHIRHRVGMLITPRHHQTSRERLALVVFLDDGTIAERPEAEPGALALGQSLASLREELAELEQRTEAARSEYEALTAKLRAGNEELARIDARYRGTAADLEVQRGQFQKVKAELESLDAKLERKVEDASRSQDDLENLMAATEIGTLFLDRALLIHRFTPRMTQLFNVQRSDTGRHIAEVSHQLDYQGFAADAQQVLETLVPLERRARSAGGESFVVRFRPYRTAQDRIEGVVVTFFDVTGLTAAEDKLRRSERRRGQELAVSRRLHEMTRQVVTAGTTPEALLRIVDASIELQRAELGTLQLLNEESDDLELVAQRGFSPSLLDRLKSAGVGGTASGRVLRTRARAAIEDVSTDPTRDGFPDLDDAGYRAVHSVPLINDRGTLIGVLSCYWRLPHAVTDRDQRLLDTLAKQAANLITRLRVEEALMRANQQLEEQSVELQEQDSRKVEFLALLAHELRNPLAAVRGAVTSLLQSAKTEAVGTRDALPRQMIALLDRQTLHITRLVNDLLDITRINHGKILLDRKSVALKESVEHVLEALRPRLDGKHLTLRVNVPSEPLYLAADSDRLQQILDNLLSNAIQHSQPEGVIEVSAERRAGRAEIKIRDGGAGIAAADIAGLFEPFFQGSTGRGAGGLGLGLTLVKKLVELHAGEVEAQSDGPGKGSQFVIRLPLSDVPRSDPAAARSPEVHVLVVDDQPDVAESLGALLRSMGHRVTIANDGESGLSAARRARPHIAVLDLGMLPMDGYELARRLRTEFSEAELTLLATTGVSRRETATLARQAGFQDLLLKPLDVDHLTRLIHDSVRLPGSARANPY